MFPKKMTAMGEMTGDRDQRVFGRVNIQHGDNDDGGMVNDGNEKENENENENKGKGTKNGDMERVSLKANRHTRVKVVGMQKVGRGNT